MPDMSWRSITGVVLVVLLTAVFSCASVCAVNTGHTCCAPQGELCPHHAGHQLHGACASAPSMVYLCTHREDAAQIAVSQQGMAAHFSPAALFASLAASASESHSRTAVFRRRPFLHSQQIPLRI
jgi:hypothetical protein